MTRLSATLRVLRSIRLYLRRVYATRAMDSNEEFRFQTFEEAPVPARLARSRVRSRSTRLDEQKFRLEIPGAVYISC